MGQKEAIEGKIDILEFFVLIRSCVFHKSDAIDRTIPPNRVSSFIFGVLLQKRNRPYKSSTSIPRIIVRSFRFLKSLS